MSTAMHFARPVTRLGTDVGETWITCEAASEMLGLANTMPPSRAPEGLPWKTAAPVAHVSGRRKTMYRLRDIERAAALMKAASLPAKTALKIVIAEIRGRLELRLR